jgi:TatD DNase family protein
MTHWIDTHAHLTSESLLPHLKELLERARQGNIQTIVNICTDSASLQKGLELSLEYPWIYNTAATTPHDVAVEGASFFPLVEQAVEQKQLIAIGETGLDFAYEHSPRKTQIDFLIRYFELAKRAKLPLIFHCRAAFQDLFALADAHYQDHPAVMHCFTGSKEDAKKALDRGWYLSFSGITTFKNANDLREVVRFVPLNRLLIETDSPYLAPLSKRGLTNEPAWVAEVGQCLAQLKNLKEEEMAEILKNNAEAIFSFSKTAHPRLY